MKLRMANAAILAYRRLSYRPWYAIAEFVDNSTDSFLRDINRKLLEESYSRTGEKLTVEVDYDKSQGLLRIADNSIGMNEDELNLAMIIGEKPIETAGRSEFGMGMKTAAIWFADTFEIRTKKLGEEYEYRTTVSIKDFVNGNDDLFVHKTPKPKDQHYTILELSDLQRQIGPSALRKTSEFLGSIYRMDLREGILLLTVNGNEVAAPPAQNDDAFLTRSDGSPYVVQIESLEVNGRKVSGWIGVLRPGFTGRNNAGFALIRHKRTIRGWLDSWRPEEIFGDARNDTLNQRVVGELIMDDFRASHTKDAIDWESDDEATLGEELKKFADQYDLLRQAKKKFKGEPESSETQIERAEAQSRLEEQLNTQRMLDTITLLDVPRPEYAKVATDVLIEASQHEQPITEFEIGNGRRARLFEIQLSPNDPYYDYEVEVNTDLRIVINANHPAMMLLNSAEARLTHYHHVTLDAIAEWTCTQQLEPLLPSSIRMMKDRLFRVVSEVDDGL